MRNWREEIRRNIHERMTTSNLYHQGPEDITQEIESTSIADITKDDGDDGRDMSGIFDDFGNSMFVDPPNLSDPNQFNNFGSNSEAYGNAYVHKFNWTNTDVVPTEINPERSDSSKNPGPLCYYYNATDDRTYIGFLRQSDRGFSQLARFDGDWDDWDESTDSGTNFSRGSVLQKTIQGTDVSWLKNQTTSGNVADFRAFVDDDDMTDTDSHGRINVKMVNTIKGENTNLWSVYSSDEPITSDQKITLKFHFRTNSYYNYRGNDAVDSDPSSINTGSTKARRAKTPAVAPVFYDSDAESPVYYNSQNGRAITDAVKDLVDTVEFTVPEGSQFNVQGNKISGKFNINGIGLKWRYITSPENPDTAHPEPDQDQNGYNHTRNFPDVPFDDYLIWTISINGQDYDLRNGIEGLTCAIGIPGYTKEKWVQGPANSRKGLPTFNNSYEKYKRIGDVDDMNLQGMNQIVNLSKTIQQLKKKKKNIQFIQKNRLKKPTLKQPTELNRTQIKQNRIQTQSLKRSDSIIKSNNSNLKKLTKGLSDSVKSDLGLDDTPKPSKIRNFTPPSADPANGNTPPKPPSGASMDRQLGLPKTEPLTPPDSKPPEGKGEPTPPDDKKLPVRPKFVDRYKQNREMTRQTNERQRKSYERTWPTISDKDIQQWKSWAAREKVSVGTVYDRAVERYYMGYEKYTYANVINPQLRYDVRALTDYYNIDSLKPQRTSPPQVWEWRIDDLERLIKAMVKNHQNEFKYLGMPADWYQMTSTSHMDFLKGKQENNVKKWQPKIESRMDELKRMKDEYAELFGGPPPDSAMGDGDSSGPGEGEGGPEGPEGAGPDGEGNPNAEPVGPEVEKADAALTNDERGIVDKVKDTVLDLAAKALGAESAKNTLDSYNEFLKDPKGPGSSPDNPLDITNNFTEKDKNILKNAVNKNKTVADKLNLARASDAKGDSKKVRDLRWSAAADTVEGALNVASSKSEGLNNTIYGGGTLDRERFRNSNGRDIVLNKTYVFRPGGSVAAAENSPLGKLASGVGLELDTLGAGSNPAVVIGGVVASQLMVGNSKKHGGLYNSPPAHMQVNVSGGTVKESLEKWERRLLKESIMKNNSDLMRNNNIWRVKDKVKNMIASREKGMRVDQKLTFSQFYNDERHKNNTQIKNKEFDYEGKPSPNGFPDQPPPKMANGFHPEYGKRSSYYRRLDPHSAAAMPKTGDPETDAQVSAAAKAENVQRNNTKNKNRTRWS